MTLKKHWQRWMLFPLLLLTFLIGSGLGYLSTHIFHSEDRVFQDYTQSIFLNEIGSNTLNLHYTLAHPEKYGITQPVISLGSIYEDGQQTAQTLENYEEKIRDFDYHKLSSQNQITYDTILLYFHTLKEGCGYQLLEELLSPSLGIQAQLPVLLAEYTFYDSQDIEDYLALLSQMDSYFQNILAFEKQKADNGYFMNEECLNGIIAQCESFIESPNENYLIDIFDSKIAEFKGLSAKDRESLQNRNQELIFKHVIPAYELLIEGLSQLRGDCSPLQGLCSFSNGREYYVWLLRTQVGVYDAPDRIRQRLYTQLVADYSELTNLLDNTPSLAASVIRNDYQISSPADALQELKNTSTKDFPSLEVTDYEIKYVHESLEEFLSPAFYLTPPVDTRSPNTIYINQASKTSDLELFTTLAHEGFPGHLYQTQYFASTDPDAIRYLPSFGGYVEGWATYIESYAYSYAKADSALTRLLWLNRSINLCLYSMVDLGVHYYGWSPANVRHYLANFGITQAAVCNQIYQAIVENPANYLRYYLGYLNFLDLRSEMQALQGENFDLKSFHQQILEIGPSQFPVLRKHLGISY